jgi:hypothetical protein
LLELASRDQAELSACGSVESQQHVMQFKEPL